MATAISDFHGRYTLPALAPGRYELHATAAFFLPLVRNNVRLRAGAQSVVNVTLDGLFDADNWLPAERRRADDPVDDWKWTLRSMASRPLLQLLDPNDAAGVSPRTQKPHRTPLQGQVILSRGDGVFGEGGLHQVLLLDRTMRDGDDAVLRADLGDVEMDDASSQPSIALVTGYELRSLLGGSTRLVAGFQSHPELTDGSPNGGFQLLRLASTEEIPIGDSLVIDVGALAQAERLEETQFEVEPFVRILANLGPGFVEEYRYAAGRELQSSKDLDELNPALNVVTDGFGRPRSDSGMHQELSLSHRVGSGMLSASVYVDRIPYGAIAGSGRMNETSLQSAKAVADQATGVFELAGPGYAARGVSVCILQTLNSAFSAWVEYDLGTALGSNGTLALADLPAGLNRHRMSAGTVTLRGRIHRSKTALRIAYRWQPSNSVTQVNEFNALPEEAYLTFYIRQRLWSGRVRPQSIDLMVEATNLLGEGYQTGLPASGQALALSQVPQAILGGLAFSF